MYLQIIWFITEDDKIDFLKSTTPEHTKETLERLGRRGSIDLKELGHRLVLYKL